MLVTLFGIVTLVRLVQNRKASLPILVILFGIVTLVRLEQAEKDARTLDDYITTKENEAKGYELRLTSRTERQTLPMPQ